MSNKLAVVAIGVGVSLLCVSQSFAGSMGNGAAQRRAAFAAHAGDGTTQYVFCYGGNSHSVYFSSVFAEASTRGPVSLSSAYSHYLTQMGYKASGQCNHATTSAAASAAKVQQEDAVRSSRTVVETNWSGG